MRDFRLSELDMYNPNETQEYFDKNERDFASTIFQKIYRCFFTLKFELSVIMEDHKEHKRISVWTTESVSLKQLSSSVQKQNEIICSFHFCRRVFLHINCCRWAML